MKSGVKISLNLFVDTTLTRDEFGISLAKGVMSMLLGKIGEYDGSKEEWPQYIERVNYFL